MDPIAHTLLGATLAETRLRNTTALAAGTLIIGANLPDVDALAMFRGGDYALLVRRGWTHGLPAMVLWPFLLTGVMLLFDRYWRQRRRRSRGLTELEPVHPRALLALACIGVWSHPFLDWLNTYGIRLLMPFDGTWFYGDTLFIVDPWVWLLMAAAVVLARSESKISIAGWIVLGAAATALITGSAMLPAGVKAAWCAGVGLIVFARLGGWLRDRTRQVATACLALFGVYLAVMFAGARLTVRHADQVLGARGIEVREVMPNPQPARITVRGGVAASDTHYYLFRVRWLDRDSFELTGDPVPITEPDRVVEAALNAPAVAGLRNWIRFPYYEAVELDDGWRVFIRDLRYVGPGQTEPSGIGMAVVDLDVDLQPR